MKKNARIKCQKQKFTPELDLMTLKRDFCRMACLISVSRRRTDMQHDGGDDGERRASVRAAIFCYFWPTRSAASTIKPFNYPGPESCRKKTMREKKENCQSRRFFLHNFHMRFLYKRIFVARVLRSRLWYQARLCATCALIRIYSLYMTAICLCLAGVWCWCHWAQPPTGPSAHK